MSTLEKKFVSAARQQVKFGPSSVSDFTKWRVSSRCLRLSGLSFVSFLSLIRLFFGSQVEILAKEHIRSLTEPKEVKVSKECAETKQTRVSLEKVDLHAVFSLAKQLRDVQVDVDCFSGCFHAH